MYTNIYIYPVLVSGWLRRLFFGDTFAALQGKLLGFAFLFHYYSYRIFVRFLFSFVFFDLSVGKDPEAWGLGAYPEEAALLPRFRFYLSV